MQKLVRACLPLLLLPSLALAQQPVPKSAGSGGSCPHGYGSSGSFCVPRAGAQDAIALPSCAQSMVALMTW